MLRVDRRCAVRPDPRVTPVQTHLPPNWVDHLLALIGGAHTHEKERYLNAQARAEGGSAAWNPLNTTFVLPGCTNYNSIGVKNYPRAVWGVCATALTFTGPADGPLTFPKLLSHLQSASPGPTAEAIVNECADEIRHWGTDPALILEILSETKAV